MKAVKFLELPFCMGKEVLVFEIFIPECKCVFSFVGITMQGFVPKRSKMHLEPVEN